MTACYSISQARAFAAVLAGSPRDRGGQGVRVGNLGVLAFCFVAVQLLAMGAMLALLLRARRDVAGSAKASQAASFLVLPVFLRILMAYAAVELLSAVVSMAVPVRVSMLNFESGAPPVPLSYGYGERRAPPPPSSARTTTLRYFLAAPVAASVANVCIAGAWASEGGRFLR
jgi:hypothetical protein